MEDRERIAHLQEAAEEVRAYLVTLRGGAPFLSPLDGRLLLEWLEADVSVPLILKALDEAAVRRRSRRARSPLRLTSIRRWVSKARALPAARPTGDLSILIEVLESSPDPLLWQAARELDDISGEGEALVRGALAVSRRFYERAWTRADQKALHRQASFEVEELQEGLSEKQWLGLVEEVARDLLRQRYPEMSATNIWDTLN